MQLLGVHRQGSWLLQPSCPVFTHCTPLCAPVPTSPATAPLPLASAIQLPLSWWHRGLDSVSSSHELLVSRLCTGTGRTIVQPHVLAMPAMLLSCVSFLWSALEDKAANYVMRCCIWLACPMPAEPVSNAQSSSTVLVTRLTTLVIPPPFSSRHL